MKYLRVGDEGREVENLQALLTVATDEAIPTRGVFDNRTKLLVTQFQRLNHLQVQTHGEVDPTTWEALLFPKELV